MKNVQQSILITLFAICSYWIFAVATSRMPRPLMSQHTATWQGEEIYFIHEDTVSWENPRINIISESGKRYYYNREISLEAKKKRTLSLFDFKDLELDKLHKKKFTPEKIEILPNYNASAIGTYSRWGIQYEILKPSLN